MPSEPDCHEADGHPGLSGRTTSRLRGDHLAGSAGWRGLKSCSECGIHLTRMAIKRYCPKIILCACKRTVWNGPMPTLSHREETVLDRRLPRRRPSSATDQPSPGRPPAPCAQQGPAKAAACDSAYPEEPPPLRSSRAEVKRCTASAMSDSVIGVESAYSPRLAPKNPCVRSARCSASCARRSSAKVSR